MYAETKKRLDEEIQLRLVRDEPLLREHAVCICKIQDVNRFGGPRGRVVKSAVS